MHCHETINVFVWLRWPWVTWWSFLALNFLNTSSHWWWTSNLLFATWWIYWLFCKREVGRRAINNLISNKFLLGHILRMLLNPPPWILSSLADFRTFEFLNRNLSALRWSVLSDPTPSSSRASRNLSLLDFQLSSHFHATLASLWFDFNELFWLALSLELAPLWFTYSSTALSISSSLSNASSLPLLPLQKHVEKQKQQQRYFFAHLWQGKHRLIHSRIRFRLLIFVNDGNEGDPFLQLCFLWTDGEIFADILAFGIVLIVRLSVLFPKLTLPKVLYRFSSFRR